MGIFTVKCTNPECGSRQKRSKSKCTECGTVLPHINRRCWNCSRTVSSDSKYCWKCGADLAKSGWKAMLGTTWQPKENELAVKVNSVEMPGTFNKSISIEQGTKALIIIENKIADELGPGTHTIENIVGIINRFGKNKKIIIVLVADRLFTIPFSFEGIRTADKKSLNISADILLRIADIETLFLQLLATESVVTIDDIKDDIKKDIETGIKLFARRISEKEIYDNPLLANEMTIDVRTALNEPLDTSGLELVGIKNFRATNTGTEELLKKSDELNVVERMQTLLTNNEISKLKDKHRLREFIEGADQENKMKIEIREDEYKRLQSQLEFVRDKEDVIRAIEISQIQNDSKRNEALDQFEHDLSISKKQFEWEITKRQSLHNQEINELDTLLDIREKKKRIDKK